MHPNIVLNSAAIAVAVVAAFVFGGVWFGPLFGKRWARLMGMGDGECKPDAKVMVRALGLQLVGTFLTAFVLAHANQVWRPSVWGVGDDAASYVYGFYGGFFTWLGFFMPLQLRRVSFERATWQLFAINSAHDFISLQIISQILAHWR